MLQSALGADVIDRSSIKHSPVARLIARMLGIPCAQAWLASRIARRYRVVLTDGEHIGIPLAALLKLGRSNVTHITIGHRVTAAKKRPFFRWVRVHSHIRKLVLHSRMQYELAVRDLRIPEDHLALVPYQVDPEFWRPLPKVAEEN